MTARDHHGPWGETDPAEETEHQPASSEWARRAAIEATRAAVAAAKEARKKPAGEVGE